MTDNDIEKALKKFAKLLHDELDMGVYSADEMRVVIDDTLARMLKKGGKG